MPTLTAPQDLGLFTMVAGLYLMSLLMAYFVHWIYRDVRADPPELNHFEHAYLIGGPLRAIEVALFQLAQEGWAKSDGKGGFVALQEIPEGLPPLMQELAWKIQAEGRVALSVDPRSLPQLEKIASRLYRRQLLLSENDFRLCRLIGRAPFALVALYALFWLWRHPGHDSARGALLVISLVAFWLLTNRERASSRLTSLGESVVAGLEAAWQERVARKKASLSDDEHGYDRLWQIKDEVLFRGLASLQGTAFTSSGPS